MLVEQRRADEHLPLALHLLSGEKAWRKVRRVSKSRQSKHLTVVHQLQVVVSSNSLRALADNHHVRSVGHYRAGQFDRVFDVSAEELGQQGTAEWPT